MSKKTQIGGRLRVHPPTLVQHPPIVRPPVVTVPPRDADGRQVVHIPDPTVAPTMSPTCPRCRCPAFTIQSGGRVFCASCQSTLGWMEGRIVLGELQPPVKKADG